MNGIIQEMIDKVVSDHAAAVIKAVMAERRMGIVDFRVMKTRRHVSARAAVMKRLRNDGFTIVKIAEVMQLSKKAVEYNLSGEIRAARNAKRARRYDAVAARQREAAILQDAARFG